MVDIDSEELDSQHPNMESVDAVQPEGVDQSEDPRSSLSHLGEL